MEKHKEAEGKGVIEGKVKSNEQIYYSIASGTALNSVPANPTSSGDVSSLGTLSPEGLTGTKFYNITNSDIIPTTKTFYGDEEKHYLTNEGEIFILPGYKMTSGNETRWYIDEIHYYTGDAKSL